MVFSKMLFRKQAKPCFLVTFDVILGYIFSEYYFLYVPQVILKTFFSNINYLYHFLDFLIQRKCYKKTTDVEICIILNWYIDIGLVFLEIWWRGEEKRNSNCKPPPPRKKIPSKRPAFIGFLDRGVMSFLKTCYILDI